MRRWRPLSPDIWQAPSAPDIPPTYMLTFPHLPQLVHICQSGPAWSCSFFFFIIGRVLRLSGSFIKGALKGSFGRRLRLTVLPCGALCRTKLPNCTACISCWLTNVFAWPTTRVAGIETPKDSEIRISNRSRHICCVLVTVEGVKRMVRVVKGSGVSGVSGRLQLISVSVVDKMCCHL